MSKLPMRSLKESLQILARKIVEEIGLMKSEGFIEWDPRLRVVPWITDFEYGKGIERFSSSLGEEPAEEWYIDEKALGSLYKSWSEFQDVVVLISKQYDTSSIRARFWVVRFCYKVLKASINRVDEGKLIELASIFLRDLEGQPNDYRSLVWLKGIWLEPSRISITNSIVLRQPTPEDIKNAYRHPGGVPPSFGQLTIVDLPSAILELNTRVKQIQEIQDILERLLIALRLYRVGSVSAIKSWHRPKSITTPSVSLGAATTYEKCRYGLRAEDAERLETFVTKIMQLVPAYMFSKPEEKTDFITIGLRRYNDALMIPGILEAKLTSAIMCMEALYLKGGERAELIRRLAQRAAKVLGCAGYCSWELHSELGEAYALRSRYVHGASLRKKEQEKLVKITQDVTDYARVSLIILLQLRDVVLKRRGKDQFLSLVDKALLDIEAADELIKLITGLEISVF